MSKQYCYHKAEYQFPTIIYKPDIHGYQSKTFPMHSSKKQFVCNFCSSKFTYRRGLTSHIRLKHSNQTLSYYTCTKCPNYKTLYRWHYKQHLFYQHDRIAAAIQCNFCTKTFARPEFHRRHLTEIHAIKRSMIRCLHCNRFFASKRSLKSHMKFSENQCNADCDSR